jgi:hypothetical protein
MNTAGGRVGCSTTGQLYDVTTTSNGWNRAGGRKGFGP